MRDRDHSLLPSRRDVTILIIVILGFGTSGPLIALSTMPIITLIFWRNLGGALLMVPLAIRDAEFRDPARRKGVMLSLASGVVLAFHFIGFFVAMRYTSIAAGTALTALQPLFTALIIKFLGGRISRHTWSAMVTSFVGVLIVTGVDFQISTRAFLGDLAAIGCAALAAVYVILGAQAREQVSTATYSTLCYLVVAAIMLVIAAIFRIDLINYSAREWLLLLALIFAAQVLGHTLMNFTLRQISPAIVSLVVFFEAPVSALLAFWWLGQLPSQGTIPGLLLVMLGCFIFWLRSSRASTNNR